MNDERPIRELIEVIGKRPEYSRYDNSDKAQKTYDATRSEIERRVRDAEWARADAEGYRERMLEQSGRIAELEADVARLTRANEIKPKPAVRKPPGASSGKDEN